MCAMTVEAERRWLGAVMLPLAKMQLDIVIARAMAEGRKKPKWKCTRTTTKT